MLVESPRYQHFRDISDIHGIKICICVYDSIYFSNKVSRIHCFLSNLTLRAECKDRGCVSLCIKRNFPWTEEMNSSVYNFLCACAYGPHCTVCLYVDYRGAHSSCMHFPRGDPAHGFVSLQGALFKSDNLMLPVRPRSSVRKKTEFIFEMTQKAEGFYRLSADLCSLSLARFLCLSVSVKSTK